MNKAAIFLAAGFEEIELVATVDVLRRGGVDLDIISVSGSHEVEGSHGISLRGELLFYNVDYTEYDLLILPGGPGVENLRKHEGLMALLPEFYGEGKKLAAICAAPGILGELGLLEGKEAICFPGVEGELTGALISSRPVVTDGRIVTAKSAGHTIDFGLEILKWYRSPDEVIDLKNRLN